ncbi:MAG TPA: hypothetical protein VLR52_00460 [Bacteroidales bacterium]|nr:hypothetical protein [Bacteroidales bacterium]
MRKLLFAALTMVTLPLMSFSQSDTIYTNNGKIVCSVKEITPEAVKFTYPNEELINSVYKNTIQKIVLKSGRVQTFAESTSYNTVTGPKDFENVTITKVEGEVKGLFKLGDVSSKAKGTTDLSNQERVKQRAYRKLKIQAAMMGANIIYLTDARTQGNKMGSKYESSQSAEASFSGVAYTNVLPDYDVFLTLLKNKTIFSAVEMVKLWSGAPDMSLKDIDKPFNIIKVYNEAGLIYINASVKGIDNDVFRVISFSQGTFVVVYTDKSSIYNLRISF